MPALLRKLQIGNVCRDRGQDFYSVLSLVFRMAGVLPPQLCSVPTYLPSEKERAYFLSTFSQPCEAAAVPLGFPSTIASSLVWAPEEAQAARNDWTLRLSSSDVSSVKAALEQVKSLYL